LIRLHPVVNVHGAKAKFLRTSVDDARVSMKKRDNAALHSSWNWELISDKTLDWWIPRLRRIKDAFLWHRALGGLLGGAVSEDGG